MIAHLKPSDLLLAVSRASRLIRRPSLEELACVLISADQKEKTLTVTSSSLDAFHIETINDVDVEREGVCLVNAKRLKDIIDLISGDMVELCFETNLSVKSDSMSVSMATLGHVNFPVAPAIGNRQFLVANFAPLSRVKMAIPTSEERLNLFGAIVRYDGVGLVGYTANGRVVGRVPFPCRGLITPERGSVGGTLFIPATHVDDVIGMGEVSVTQFDSWIAFESPSSTLIIKKMSIEPLDIKSHIDKLKFDAKCIVAREDLLSKARAAHLLRKDTDTIAHLCLSQEPNALRVEARTHNGGMNEPIVCKASGNWGAWSKAVFPSDNFISALTPSEADVVKIHFGDPTSVVCIDDGLVEIFIMPMRS